MTTITTMTTTTTTTAKLQQRLWQLQRLRRLWRLWRLWRLRRLRIWRFKHNTAFNAVNAVYFSPHINWLQQPYLHVKIVVSFFDSLLEYEVRWVIDASTYLAKSHFLNPPSNMRLRCYVKSENQFQIFWALQTHSEQVLIFPPKEPLLVHCGASVPPGAIY